MRLSCHQCNRSNVKLWRCSGGYPAKGQLLCNNHLESAGPEFPDQRRGPGIPSHIKISYVPAILYPDGQSFYSVTAVPSVEAEQWKLLSE